MNKVRKTIMRGGGYDENSSIADGVGAIVVGLLQTAVNLHYDYENLQEDGRMVTLAESLMNTGKIYADTILFNTASGLYSVLAKDITPYPYGEIRGITHWSYGQYGLLGGWDEKEVVSKVKIYNAGDIPAIFNLGARATTKDNWYVWNWMTPPGDNVLGVSLNPGEEVIVDIHHDLYSNEIHTISYFLVAYTDNGVYYQDQRLCCDYLPLLITTNTRDNEKASKMDHIGNNTKIRPYPIDMYVSSPQTSMDYNVSIRVRNSFEFPIAVELTQSLREATELIFVDNRGHVVNNIIVWQKIIQPHDILTVKYIIRPTSSPGTTFEIPGAKLSFHYAQRNSTRTYYADPIKLMVKPSFVADVELPKNIISEGSNLVNITIKNLINDKLQLKAIISLSSWDNTSSYEMERVITVSGKEKNFIQLNFSPMLESGEYLLSVIIWQDEVSVVVGMKTINVSALPKTVERPTTIRPGEDYLYIFMIAVISIVTVLIIIIFICRSKRRKLKVGYKDQSELVPPPLPLEKPDTERIDWQPPPKKPDEKVEVWEETKHEAPTESADV